MICDSPGWSGRWKHASVFHRGNMYVIGGYGDHGYCNDVWSSDDGMTWQRLTTDAQFPPRAMHTLLVHRGILYVIGGFGGHECLNDVWASVSGQRWTRVCHSAPWLPRHSHVAVSHGEFIYVMGGDGPSTTLNDIWKSRDGALWELVTIEAPWSARLKHAAVVRDDLLFVIGGMDGEHSYPVNDVYCMGLPSTAIDNGGSGGSGGSGSGGGSSGGSGTLGGGAIEPDSVPLSMEAVINSVIELQQLRAGLEEVQRGNQKIVETVMAAARMDISYGDSPNGTSRSRKNRTWSSPYRSIRS